MNVHFLNVPHTAGVPKVQRSSNFVDKENLAPDHLRQQRTKCIKNGKCIDTDEDWDWQECNGKCIEYGSLCGGQCYDEMCRKGNKCLPLNNKERKTCNGECIGVTETCDGKCEFDDCLMNDGSCLKIKEKSQIWKSCKGKCIKSSIKCDGSCSWGQCEMNDGTCTYTIAEVVRSGREDGKNGNVDSLLKFGICAGQCVEILTNTSTPTCHGQCEPIPGTHLHKFGRKNSL